MMLNNNQLESRLLALNGVEYAKVSGDGITTGSLHALTMKTFTKSEWEKERG